MGIYSKQFAVYASEMILCLGFTIISPFYSSVATSKGVPMWLIGLIYALDPICAIPASFLISFHMKTIGRQLTLSLGIGLISLSIFLLSMIESLPLPSFLIVSIISRILAGAGQGFSVLAGTAILTSEYPESLEKVIAYYETCGGVGLILGPILGSLLSSWDLVYSFSMLGGVIGISMFLIHFMVKGCKTYSEENSKISFIELAFKPVVFYLDDFS